jgi:hypothetical protein
VRRGNSSKTRNLPRTASNLPDNRNLGKMRPNSAQVHIGKSNL